MKQKKIKIDEEILITLRDYNKELVLHSEKTKEKTLTTYNFYILNHLLFMKYNSVLDMKYNSILDMKYNSVLENKKFLYWELDQSNNITGLPKRIYCKSTIGFDLVNGYMYINE